MVDCWVIHHPPLDFHGAGNRGRHPYLYKHAPSSRTSVSLMPIVSLLCDEFLFFVFLAEDLKKNMVCPVVKKSKLWVSFRTVLHTLHILILLIIILVDFFPFFSVCFLSPGVS